MTIKECVGDGKKISSSTRIQFTILQIGGFSVFIISMVASACGIYFGIKSEIQDRWGHLSEQIKDQKNETTSQLAMVNEKLTEMNWKLQLNLTREEFRGWVDEFRTSNPNERVPSLSPRNN